MRWVRSKWCLASKMSYWNPVDCWKNDKIRMRFLQWPHSRFTFRVRWATNTRNPSTMSSERLGERREKESGWKMAAMIVMVFSEIELMTNCTTGQLFRPEAERTMACSQLNDAAQLSCGENTLFIETKWVVRYCLWHCYHVAARHARASLNAFDGKLISVGGINVSALWMTAFSKGIPFCKLKLCEITIAISKRQRNSHQRLFRTEMRKKVPRRQIY